MNAAWEHTRPGWGTAAVGNLERVSLPSGVVSDYDYDTLNRLDFLTVRNASGSLFTQDYFLEPDGLRDYARETDVSNIARARRGRGETGAH